MPNPASSRIGDVWPTALAIPGFVGGIVFSALLRIAEGRRSFDERAMTRYSAWGAVTGLVLGLLTMPAKVGDVSPGALGMIGIGIVLGTVAAIGAGIFFRLIPRRQTAAVARP